MPDQPLLLLATALAFLLAGFVKGVIGLGLPTIAIGLLGLVMTPTEAAAILVVPSFVTNIWQIADGPPLKPLVRRLFGLLAATCLGVLAGAYLLAGVSPKAATAALGLLVALYALYGLFTPPLVVPARAEPLLAPIVGGLTGFGAAVTGVFMMPGVPYLQALGLTREGLIQALGLFFTVSTVALAGALAANGLFTRATVLPSAVALGTALAGMPLGAWLRRRIEPQAFRLCFFLGLLALGLYLTWRGMA